MAAITLPHEWTPRHYQRSAWNAWVNDGYKRLFLLWHRRAGKDDLCLHGTAAHAMERVGNYWHVLPEYEQARKAIWSAVNPHTRRRRIDDAFPSEIIAGRNEQEMKITFVNGATWQLVGSNRIDALMGSTPVGVVNSEYALSNPNAWAYIRPILGENNGWATFITTPRGKNHAYRMYNAVKDDPAWFVQRLSADTSGVFPPDFLPSERKSYHAEYGVEDGDNLFRQEYLVDFEAANLGSYYAGELRRARAANQVCNVPYDPRFPVYGAWDIGTRLRNVIVCFQVVGQEMRVIDCIVATTDSVTDTLRQLRDSGYDFACQFLPHDGASSRTSRTGETIADVVREKYNVQIIKRVSRLHDDIQLVRRTFPFVYFDEKKCDITGGLLEMLADYSRDFDRDTRLFSDKPALGQANHFADAFRYACVAFGLIGSGERQVQQHMGSMAYDTGCQDLFGAHYHELGGGVY